MVFLALRLVKTLLNGFFRLASMAVGAFVSTSIAIPILISMAMLLLPPGVIEKWSQSLGHGNKWKAP